MPFSLQKVKFLQDKCKTESVSVSISTSTYLPISLSISKIPTDGDCSHEIRRRLLLGRKAKTNLESELRSRDITLPTKVLMVKAMVFPVVPYIARAGPSRRQNTKELMIPLNCGAGKDSQKSLRQQGDQTSQS